jgi:predicted transcriptional regulator
MSGVESGVDQLLATLAEAARCNDKAEFDRLERELLSRFDGGFDSMPEDLYQRYLDVDRHWPIAVVPADGASARRRTLQIRLAGEEEAWIQELAVATDRSLSAVIAECIDAVRSDESQVAEVRERLKRGRSLEED